MKKIIGFFIIIAVIVTMAFHYHFILLDSGLRVLKKVEWTLDSTFVDARGPNKIKLILNPALTKAGIKELLQD